MPRAFPRPGFSRQAPTVPLMMQLVQYPNASGLDSIRVLLTGTNCTANLQLVQSPNASRLYSTRTLLTDTNYATDAAACGPLMPSAFTRPGFFWQAQIAPPMLQLVQSPNASRVYLVRVLLAGKNCTADAAACAVSERVKSSLDP